ncbi:SANT/Myb domain [Macleaya cordata]|uniref:SANT/Myb domain n=1 Tax=Macleaya cordata TaxID=56857 RepID=A0A200PR34_MACCD|nr:SANT/Myb domain [Macleaya cordata]
MAAAQLPVKKLIDHVPEVTPPKPPPGTPQTPSSPVVISEILGSDSKDTSSPVVSKPSKSSSSASDVISIPSYSRWFSWDKIHESERRFLPEFFDGRSPSKNPTVYKYYRDAIIKKFRENPSRKITFTELRKVLVGDVGSIRRVFDFLEGWGLINYTGTVSKPQSKWEDKGNNKSSEGSPFEASLSKKETTKKLCNGCKSVCSIACFVCDQYDITLCARCYVRGNYRVGVVSSDFRRVEISEETKTGWTEKETLHLLEAVMHFGDDWKKVAEHVGGRSEKECVARFIKLPFREQFVGPPDSGEVDEYCQIKDQNDAETEAENIFSSSQAKRRCLTPLADASNPIMAQAAFLSAMAGSEVSEAAARAAVAALSEVDLHMGLRGIKEVSAAADNGDSTLSKSEEAVGEAQALLEKEERDLDRSISGIVEVQMKEIQEKIVRFEEVELQMEKEWHQLQHMKNLLFADQMAFLFHRTTPLTNEASIEKGSVKTTDIVT